ncbi:MAG: hypothetical protein ACYCW6_32610, partial [Candidatus Xenobia bacterium]
MRRPMILALAAALLVLVLMEWVAGVRAARPEIRARYAEWLLSVQAGPQPEVVGTQDVDAAGQAGPLQGVQTAAPPLRLPHGDGVRRLWIDVDRLAGRLGARVVMGTVAGGVPLPELGMTAMPATTWP